MRRLKPVPASPAILEKIETRHGLDFSGVEALFARPHLVLRGSEDQYGERRYTSLGQASGGRYLLVVWVHGAFHTAKIITARDMTDREKSYFRRVFRPGRKS